MENLFFSPTEDLSSRRHVIILDWRGHRHSSMPAHLDGSLPCSFTHNLHAFSRTGTGLSVQTLNIYKDESYTERPLRDIYGLLSLVPVVSDPLFTALRQDRRAKAYAARPFFRLKDGVNWKR